MTAMKNTLEARFVALETKAAYQEKLIADLNDVLLERGRTLDFLVKRVEKLESTVRGEAPDPIDTSDRPPHY